VLRQKLGGAEFVWRFPLASYPLGIGFLINLAELVMGTVDLTILNLPPHEQIAALMDRRIDMGFVPLPVVELDPAIEFEPVREVELMVALPPGHRLAKQHRLTLRKLATSHL
jgi:DNA-binding transcriptional LysR family regulator